MQRKIIYWRIHFVFALSAAFEPSDVLDTELHNCQSIFSKHYYGDSAKSPHHDHDRADNENTGRLFAVLRRKRPLRQFNPAEQATVPSTSSIGALVGVCLDGVDESTKLDMLVDRIVNNNMVFM